MSDLIDRQAAIDAIYALSNYTIAWLESVVDEIEALPSAQSEIIRCRDCKHYYYADNRIPQEQRYVCDLNGDRWKPDDYCSFAERMKGKQE